MRVVAAETVADYAVAVAVAIASDAPARWLPVLTPGRAADGTSAVPLHEEIGSGRLVAPELWTRFQRLWYRWQSPLDRVSPMRWYLAALATAAGVEGARLSQQTDVWLQVQAALDPQERARHVASIAALDPAREPVLAGGDPLSGLAFMLASAIDRRPFVWSADPDDVADLEPPPAEALAALSRAAIASSATPDAAGRQPRAPSPTRGWEVAPLRDEALARWRALGGPQRAELLDALHDQLAILGPLRVEAVGRALDNDRALKLVLDCTRSDPAAWEYHELVFVTALWLWRLSGVNFTELNQADLDFTGLDAFLRCKRARYRALLEDGDRGPAGGGTFEVASSLPDLRRRVEERHVRCFTIDGGSWERREHMLQARRVRADALPAAFVDHIAARVGVDIPDGGSHRRRLDAFVEAMADAGVNPAEALVAIADYVLHDDCLQPDYAVLTAARGIKLDEPWVLELPDVFSYVSMREQCEWRERGVRLADLQIRNAITQRMRYNVTRRARNYSPERSQRLEAQPFQFPDVASMEDAHHGGHRASGIRLALRAPFVVQTPSGTHWRGLADLRINRVSYRDDDRYSLADLPRLIRYSRWSKAIVESAYARGLVLDAAYGRKLESATRRAVPQPADA